MGLAIRTTLSITGDDLRKVAERQRSLRPLMRRVGVYMMSRGLQRLVASVRPEQFRPGIRQSLTVGPAGGGGTNDTIFEPDANSVSVGSKMPHAAIHQFGGTIRPVTGKALAIPLLDPLKRQAIWPRDIPRDEMEFVPSKRSGIIGFLVNREKTITLPGDKTLRIKQGRGRRKNKPVKRTALFMLVAQVKRDASPFLEFRDEDQTAIGGMTKRFLEGK